MIPVFLFLWHKYIQPFLLRFGWNPWNLLDDGSSRIITTKKVGIFDVKIVTPKKKDEKGQGDGKIEDCTIQSENGKQKAPPISPDATSSSLHSKID